MLPSVSQNQQRTSESVASTTFTETTAWQHIGEGWRPLFGSFAAFGFSFEWHDFQTADEFDWSSTFHPGSVELCLNVAGEGRILHEHGCAVVHPLGAAFYCQTAHPLRASRAANQRHQFLAVEFAPAFLREHLSEYAASLHRALRLGLDGDEPRSWVSDVVRLGSRQQQMLQSLREPPILAAAQALWYRTKALELAAEFFFEPATGDELFCQRHKRLASQRVERVIAMLRRDLVNPPTLEDIGKAVGCSPFHLSRTFSGETGMTIPQYIRRLRLDKAAELLKSGRHNVTEVAFAVGYSSLSHFSTAFHQTFGCCPGLYPLQTESQRKRTV